MNLIGTLEIGEEYGVCPLLFRGRSSDLQNDPNLQANLNFQANPTNKSSFCRMGGALLQAASQNISSSHPFFRMGGDALKPTLKVIAHTYGYVVDIKKLNSD